MGVVRGGTGPGVREGEGGMAGEGGTAEGVATAGEMGVLSANACWAAGVEVEVVAVAGGRAEEEDAGWVAEAGSESSTVRATRE